MTETDVIQKTLLQEGFARVTGTFLYDEACQMKVRFEYVSLCILLWFIQFALNSFHNSVLTGVIIHYRHAWPNLNEKYLCGIDNYLSI